MLALDTLLGIRVNANPAAIDAATWPEPAVVIRISPDDLFVFNLLSYDEGIAAIVAVDSHAIAEQETGFCGTWLTPNQFERVIAHIEWPLPAQRPALAQGFIAGVPAKLWLTDGLALLLCGRPNVADLLERIA